jgi:hypothetical protein
MMRSILTVILAAVLLSSCGNSSPTSGQQSASAPSSNCRRTLSAEQCTCAQNVLSVEHFEIFGRQIAALSSDGTLEERRQRSEYAVNEGMDGNIGRAFAYNQGLQIVQNQCHINLGFRTESAPPPAAIPSASSEDAQAAALRSFERASVVDTVEAYEAFLREYPRSEHALAARGRIAELQATQ